MKKKALLNLGVTDLLYKTCRVCNKEKDCSDFARNSLVCKECRYEYERKWKFANLTFNCLYPQIPKKIAMGRRREARKKWILNNPEKDALCHKKYNSANKHKRNRMGRDRQARKKSAMPEWSDKFIIDEMYALANLRTKLTGINWEVDHIVPLTSKIVCGLHCEQNLQVITRTQNRSKGNRFWPCT